MTEKRRQRAKEEREQMKPRERERYKQYMYECLEGLEIIFEVVGLAQFVQKLQEQSYLINYSHPLETCKFGKALKLGKKQRRQRVDRV